MAGNLSCFREENELAAIKGRNHLLSSDENEVVLHKDFFSAALWERLIKFRRKYSQLLGSNYTLNFKKDAINVEGSASRLYRGLRFGDPGSANPAL